MRGKVSVQNEWSFYLANKFQHITSPESPPENNNLAFSDRAKTLTGSGHLSTSGSYTSLTSKILIVSSKDPVII